MFRRKFYRGLGILGILVLVFGLASCGRDEDTYVYENKELGFSLDLPRAWEDRLEIREDLDQARVYFNHQAHEDKYENGLLFSIDRRLGQLITEEDVKWFYVPQEILAVDNGYTYLKTLPSDVQYEPSDEEDSREYLEMREGIDQVLESFKTLKIMEPRASREGYRLIGSNFFTVEVREDWKVKASNSNPFIWKIYQDKKELGEIEFSSYDDVELEETGRQTIYLEDEDLLRRFRISLDQDYSGELAVMEETMELLGDSYTSLDEIYNLRSYLVDGGRKLYGEIVDLDFDNRLPRAISIRTETGVFDYETDYPRIIPMKDGNYPMYGSWILDLAYTEENPNYRQAHYEFIINSEDKLIGIIERFK